MLRKTIQKSFACMIALLFVVSIGVISADAKAEFEIRNGILMSYHGTASTVTVPDGVTEIFNRAFWGNQTVKTVILPDSVTRISAQAFQQATNLKKITLSNNLEIIGSAAFGGCKSLKSIPLPQSLTLIEDYTFNGCSALSEIILPENVTGLMQYSFVGTPWAENKMSKTGYLIVNDVLLDASEKIKSAKTLTVPAGVKKVALLRCRATSIAVPPSVTDIGTLFTDKQFGTVHPTKLYGVKKADLAQFAQEGMKYTSLKLKKTELTLAKGKSCTLKFNSGSIGTKYSTSDKSVVKVSKNGKLTAVSKGSAKITVTLYGKKYTCTVTVS